ncbi:hypothetical protein BY996DRAFT_6508145 [Phakopsora pachyrhizi]|nr:hypothetical protein BY996DRAFT_6508145 [Phakopsora pachyrhizi]
MEFGKGGERRAPREVKLMAPLERGAKVRWGAHQGQSDWSKTTGAMDFAYIKERGQPSGWMRDRHTHRKQQDRENRDKTSRQHKTEQQDKTRHDKKTKLNKTCNRTQDKTGQTHDRLREHKTR